MGTYPKCTGLKSSELTTEEQLLLWNTYARDGQYHKLKDNDEADQKPKATKIIDVSRTALYRIHIVPHHNNTVW